MSTTYVLAGGHSGNLAYSESPSNGWLTQLVGTSHLKALTFGMVSTTEGYYAFAEDGSIWITASGTFWHNPREPFDHTPHAAASYDNDVLVVLADGYLGEMHSGYGWSETPLWTDGHVAYGIAGLLPTETPANLEAARFMVAGTRGRIATSDGWMAVPGGRQWTNRTSPFGTTHLTTVSRGDGRWMIGGDDGMLAFSLDDGETWTTCDSRFDGSSLYRVVFDQLLGWIAVGAEGKISISLDGTTWEPCVVPRTGACAPVLGWLVDGHRWLSAVPVGDCWIVGGDNNTIVTVCPCSDYYYDAGTPSLPA